jgi:hypothetical protein
MLPSDKHLHRLRQECNALRSDLTELENLAARLRADSDAADETERRSRLERSLNEIEGEIDRMRTTLVGREQEVRSHEQATARRRSGSPRTETGA